MKLVNINKDEFIFKDDFELLDFIITATVEKLKIYFLFIHTNGIVFEYDLIDDKFLHIVTCHHRQFFRKGCPHQKCNDFLINVQIAQESGLRDLRSLFPIIK
ncbi:hypothetical protein QJU11_04375 [Pasteurella atlantica]|uniref:hypothetical protein n=1 Tax=Phocoenobacter atlanticus TaxID=3416742 RepID=UPI0027647E82|nr:hypothetical protein [Pasteurella atlantica]MDP8041445.1 hypothetical protein [Pasteurella atlantica]